ncbi:hypothetical protein CO179_00235 [candidate division WWE3 bacterium CG_4_9_14_3_um_filter_39_7]|nr:MAG: hypothetical protein CO179_00235 [candidate division WWE3 bacterium CG_4_9_14_3_um_filter_39_7]
MADTPRESMPQIHVVQSQHINTIASKFDTTFRKKARSIVTGIVARQTDRKELVIDAVKATNGSGWIVTDDEVLSAINTLTEYGVTDFSKEGALAYAGFIKAQTVNFKINSHVVVVLT